MEDCGNTRWSVIRRAAQGSASDREEFVRRYSPVIRACLGARWRHSPLLSEIDDATQNVFLECFQRDGPLTRADSKLPGGFGAFLYGVVRNIARRLEKARGRSRERQPGSRLDFGQVPSREESASHAFDRAWARSLLRQAAEVQAERAEAAGDDARRRVELLRLRFFDEKPIREIAALWHEDVGRVHYEYLRARNEFKGALQEVVREHDPAVSVEKECQRILRHLSD